MASLVNYTKHLKKKFMTFFLKLYQKTEDEGKLSNSFYKTSIVVIPNPDKDTTRKEKYKPIFLVKINARILNRILANRTLKISYSVINWYLSLGCKNSLINANEKCDKTC